MSKLAILLVLAIVPVIYSRDPDCVAPGQCTPPSTQYSKLLPTGPRKQWGDSGGFCGALSVQTGMLTYGTWVSQDIIRKNTIYGGGGHGNPTEGYELLYTNINSTFENLKFNYEQWDISQPQPQANAFLKWSKSHLAAGHPLVVFVMEKGNTHNAYNMGYHFDHIEPIFGLYSNHELTDATVYDDDWFVMGSDYSPDGQQNLGYFRTFVGYPDSLNMDGNCKNAQAGWGYSEMYPCMYDQISYGNVNLGPVDPKGQLIPTSLDVGSYSEPDLRQGESPANFNPTVTVTGLKSGANYVIYRYNDFKNVPTDSNYDSSNYHAKHAFTASGETYVYKDSETIISSGSTYYRTLPAATGFME